MSAKSLLVKKGDKVIIKRNSKTNGINGSPWSTFFLTAPYITLFFIFIALERLKRCQRAMPMMLHIQMQWLFFP